MYQQQYESGVPSYNNNNNNNINMQNQVLFNNAQPNTSGNVMHKGTTEERGRAPKPKRIRTSFTSFQLNRLEEVFKLMHVITRSARYNLSLELNLHEKQIKIWFQNRRMKEKKENSKAANNAGTPSLQTPANRNNSTVQNHRGCNTVKPQMLPPYQYDAAQNFSPSTTYYANPAGLLDQSAYQNNLLLQISSSSSSCNTNSPPMDQNQGYQNAALQMPSTSTYSSNSPPVLSQNLGYHSILQVTSTPSNNSNSPPTLNQNLGYHSILQVPSTSSNNSNSSPLMDPAAIPYQTNDLPSNLSPVAVKAISPTSYQSNSPTIDPTSYQFDGIQGDIVAPQFITPSFKNEDCIDQYPSLNENNIYLSPVANPTNEEQNFSGDINYYEIEQILGNSY